MDSKLLNTLNIKSFLSSPERLLINKLPKESISESGLILDAGRKVNDKGQLVELEDVSEEDNTFNAEIVDIGSGLSPYITIGLKIMVSKHSGIELKKGTGLLLIREADILAYIS